MFSSIRISTFRPPLSLSNPLSTSSVYHKRMGKRVRNVPEWKRLKLSQGPWWRKDPIVMRAPLARTQHPSSQFSKLEEDIQASVAAESASDLPVQEMEDPYAAPALMCVLCPRRYAAGHAPQPSYLNPKLLSQFTSPHTGKLYDKHITGLCSKMQALGRCLVPLSALE